MVNFMGLVKYCLVELSLVWFGFFFSGVLRLVLVWFGWFLVCNGGFLLLSICFDLNWLGMGWLSFGLFDFGLVLFGLIWLFRLDLV